MSTETTEKREPVREVFEILAGRCRDVATAGAEAQCAHLYALRCTCVPQWNCALLPVAQLQNSNHGGPLRRTDGLCPFGAGPIRMTMEASDGAPERQNRRKALDVPMSLREYDSASLAPLKYGPPPTGGKR